MSVPVLWIKSVVSRSSAGLLRHRRDDRCAPGCELRAACPLWQQPNRGCCRLRGGALPTGGPLKGRLEARPHNHRRPGDRGGFAERASNLLVGVITLPCRCPSRLPLPRVLIISSKTEPGAESETETGRRSGNGGTLSPPRRRPRAAVPRQVGRTLWGGLPACPSEILTSVGRCRESAGRSSFGGVPVAAASGRSLHPERECNRETQTRELKNHPAAISHTASHTGMLKTHRM